MEKLLSQRLSQTPPDAHPGCLVAWPSSPIPSELNGKLCSPQISPRLFCSLLSLEPAHHMARSQYSIYMGPNFPTDTMVALSLLGN